MLRFCRMRTLQRFAVVHASVQNDFNAARSLYSRRNFNASRPPLLLGGASFWLPDALCQLEN